MRSVAALVLVPLVAALLLSGCASTPKGHAVPSPAAGNATPTRHGGYYQDDGPGDNPPDNLDQLPDATPRVEAYASGANRPYNVFGKDYVPDTSDRPFVERGYASWYGRKFNGQRTSSGEIYNMYAMTAAHPTLPIPSYARITNPGNGRSVIVRINDRGPFHPGRIIDLSFAAAYRLGYTNVGSTVVEVERLLPRDIAAGRYGPTTAEPVPVLSANASDLPADLIPAEALARGGGDSIAAGAPVTAELPVAGHYLQLAAFRGRAGAEGFLQHLTGELEPALAARLRINLADSYYRVQLGPYTDRSEAEGAAERLRGDLGIAPIIVPPH
jgi:rare lipoprotein A